MTESDLPYIKPESEIPQKANEAVSPSPDVKNPLPNHDSTEKLETEDFVCIVCGKLFITKADFDSHLEKDHGQINKA